MEILATLDLTTSYRATAESPGVSFNIVRSFIAASDEGRFKEATTRKNIKAEPFMKYMEA